MINETYSQKGFIDKYLNSTGLNMEYYTNLGSDGTLIGSVSSGFSFGDYDYEDIPNIEDYTSYQYFKGFLMKYF